MTDVGSGNRRFEPAVERRPDHDLARLVAAAQRGDREAFGEIYAAYARAVRGVLRARVAPAYVDDLLQDVFMTALQRLSSLRDAAALGGWLMTIARNRAIDHHRRTPQTVELVEEPASEAPGQQDEAEARAILALIRRLPDAYRETLTLRLVEGMTGPEIAVRTGLTEGSVRVNLHRGMKQLREQLNRRPE